MDTTSDANRLPFIRIIMEDNLLSYRDFILQNSSAPLNFAKNTVISRTGTPCSGVYFLVNGVIKVSTLNINGYERILGYHKKNTFFAMDGLRSDENVIVTTTAITNVSAIYLSAENLSLLFQKKPKFAIDTLVYYCDVLKLMCHDAEYQYGNSVHIKLANFIILCIQSEDFHSTGFLPFSQSELASAIGASRAQVARVCSKLKQQNHIDIKKRRLYILNPEYFYDYVFTSRLK